MRPTERASVGPGVAVRHFELCGRIEHQDAVDGGGRRAGVARIVQDQSVRRHTALHQARREHLVQTSGWQHAVGAVGVLELERQLDDVRLVVDGHEAQIGTIALDQCSQLLDDVDEVRG